MCRDVFLLNKPSLYISDYFVKTPLAFEGTTTTLASARFALFLECCFFLVHLCSQALSP